jgi:hypothetical protein
MKMPARFAAALLLILVLTSGCSFEIDYDRYAIAYGVGEYDPDHTLNNLPYSAGDAVAVSDLLSGQGYAVTTRTDADAVKASLLADLAAVAAAVSEDDLFLFYYAGHGGQIPWLQGTENEGSGSLDEWIFLHGSIVYVSGPDNDPASYAVDPDQTFNDDELAEALRSIPCIKKVVILDACNSGGFIGDSPEEDGLPPAYDGDEDGWFSSLGDAISVYINFDDEVFDIPPELALVIAAAGEQEVAWAGGLAPHHVLTYFLLKTPVEGDRNKDGWVTVTEAYDYILTGIETYWNPDWNPGATDIEAEWVFAPHVSGGPLDYLLFEAR